MSRLPGSFQVIGIFVISFIYARMQGPVEVDKATDSLKEKAEELIVAETAVVARDGTKG
jgi:hypothetical protein